MYILMIRNGQTNHKWVTERSSGSMSDLKAVIADENLSATDYAIVAGTQIAYTDLSGYRDQDASLKALQTTLRGR